MTLTKKIIYLLCIYLISIILIALGTSGKGDFLWVFGIFLYLLNTIFGISINNEVEALEKKK